MDESTRSRTPWPASGVADTSAPWMSLAETFRDRESYQSMLPTHVFEPMS